MISLSIPPLPGHEYVGDLQMITGSALLDMFEVFSGSNDHSVMITP